MDTQGFMEGGCESGETAASKVLAGRGIVEAVASATVSRRVPQAIRAARRHHAEYA